MKAQFKYYYDKFIIVEAVDGKNMKSKEYYDIVIKQYLKNKNDEYILSPSEAGCSISHINVLKKFLHTNEKVALILEDDIIADDKKIQYVEQIANKISNNTILILGGQDGLSNKRYLMGKYDNELDLYRVAEFSKKYIYRTCCYLITRDVAEKIIYQQERGLVRADRWNLILKNRNIKLYYKNIMSHPTDLNTSSIEKERSKIEEYFKIQGEKNIYKRIKNKIQNILIPRILRLFNYEYLRAQENS